MDLDEMCHIGSIKWAVAVWAVAVWAVAVWADHFVIATVFYKQLYRFIVQSDNLPWGMELKMETSFSNLMYFVK